LVTFCYRHFARDLRHRAVNIGEAFNQKREQASRYSRRPLPFRQAYIEKDSSASG
jgi:hypothetical protein